MDEYVPVDGYVICYCGTRLAKRTGWFEFETNLFNHGEPTKLQAEYDGMYRIGCKKCKFKTMFVSVKETVIVA